MAYLMYGIASGTLEIIEIPNYLIYIIFNFNSVNDKANPNASQLKTRAAIREGAKYKKSLKKW